MKLLKRAVRTFIPIDQPTDFPRFFLIPETTTLQSTLPASNDTFYHPPQRPTPIRKNTEQPSPVKPAQEGYMARFVQRENEKFMHLCTSAWEAATFMGRKIIRWLARRPALKTTGAATAAVTILGTACNSDKPKVLTESTSNTPDKQKPNILWISCEDISPNLGCYGDSYASTPNLDRLGVLAYESP